MGAAHDTKIQLPPDFCASEEGLELTSGDNMSRCTDGLLRSGFNVSSQLLQLEDVCTEHDDE